MVNPFAAKVASTEARRDSEWIKPGTYLMQILSLNFGTTRAQRDYVCWKLKVLQVIDTAAAALHADGPHRVGDVASWMLMADKDASASTLKAAVKVLTGFSDEDLSSAEGWEVFWGTEQPFAGMFVIADVRIENSKTKTVALPDGRRVPTTFTLTRFKRVVDKSEVLKMIPEETLKSLRIA